MTEKVRISRNDAIELLIWVGYHTVSKWDNEKLAEKVLSFADVREDDKEPDTNNLAKTILTVEAALEEKAEFEVYDEEETSTKEPEATEETTTNESVKDKEAIKAGKEKAKEEAKAAKAAKKAKKIAAKATEKKEKEEAKIVQKAAKNAKRLADKAEKEEAKVKKEEEEAAAKERDKFHYKTYATEVPKFIVYDDRFVDEEDSPNLKYMPNMTVAQAKEYLKANVANRYYKPAIAKRYSEDQIRKEWKQTLEALILDADGKGVSLQHRLEGLIYAEKLRAKEPDYYKEKYGWDDSGVTMPAVVSFGADPTGNDYHDRGQIRSGGDVFFRRGEFSDLKKADQNKLTKDLAIAARLCWLRLGQMKVSDAPHFPHSEMLNFLNNHPRLRDMVLYVHNEDGGKNKRIVKYLRSRGYLAALSYLFGISDTDKENYPENPDDLNYDKWEKAEEFVTEFASGISDDETNPNHQLRQWLVGEMSKEKKSSRDTKINMIIKTWKAFVAGESIETKQMKLKKKEDLSIGSLIG